MLVLKLFTLLMTKGSTVSLCEKVIALCVWKGDCLCMWKGDHLSAWKGNYLHIEKAIASVCWSCWSWGWWSMQRGSTVNFHMENSKDLTYFSCMLVLKLFTLLFTIDAERINSLCMWKGDCLCMWKGNCLCTWKGDHLCWFLGGWGDQWITQRGSTVNFHMENSKDLTYFCCMLVLKLFTLLFTIDTERINSLCMWKGDCLCMWKGHCLCTFCKRWLHPGGLMIDAERINSQLSHGKFKRFNLFLLHVGIKTVYITVYNWHREDQQSACEKVITSVHEKVITSAHEKVIASVDPGDWLMQRGSTVNFYMKNSKDLIYFCCMLVLKLFTLQFTIDTERINSQLSHGKFKI